MVVVTLVHGTILFPFFNREVEWIRPDSALSTELRRVLGECVIQTFSWSGGNSHRARLEAADELQALLAETARRHGPSVPHFVVAHSHGGNVALYAAARGVAPAGIVSLATPFFACTPRNHSRRFQHLRIALVVLAALALCAAVATFFGDNPLGILVFMIVSPFIPWLYDAGDDLEGRLESFARDRAKVLTAPRPACPLLALRYPADEAQGFLHAIALVIRAGLLRSELVTKLTGVILRNFVGLIFLTFVATIVLSVASTFSDAFWVRAGPSALAVMVGLALPALALIGLVQGLLTFLLWPTVVGGHRGGLGAGGVLDGFAVDIRTTPTLDGADSLELGQSDGASFFKFRHSAIHDQVEVASRVGAWIGMRVRRVGSVDVLESW